MDERTISGTELRNWLARAAQVRAIVTMLSWPVVWLAWFGSVADRLGTAIAVLVLFGGPAIIALLLTFLYCRPMVRCPHCGVSLWGCGTGNFKPRRMQLREDAKACPGCGARIT